MSIKARLWAASAVGAFLLVAVTSYLGARDKRVALRALAEVHAEAVDSIQGEVERAERATDEALARLQVVQAEADSIIAQADSTVRVLRAARPQVVDSVIVAAGPDSTVVREAVEAVSATFEAEVSELQRITMQQAAVIQEQRATIEELTGLSTHQASLIATLEASVETLQGAQDASWLPGGTKTLLGVAAVAGVAWAASRSGR